MSKESVLRVSTAAPISDFIEYSLKALHQQPVITLAGTGQAVNKTLLIAELIKAQVPGLHQQVEIESIPMGNGGDDKTTPLLTIKLTKDSNLLNKNHYGFQQGTSQVTVKPRMPLPPRPASRNENWRDQEEKEKQSRREHHKGPRQQPPPVLAPRGEQSRHIERQRETKGTYSGKRQN
jgi:Alba